MRRVLKPGGRLILSVPFGVYQNWGFFQQFDSDLLERAAEVSVPAFEKIDGIDTRALDGNWQTATRAGTTATRNLWSCSGNQNTVFPNWSLISPWAQGQWFAACGKGDDSPSIAKQRFPHSP
jgi:hypothetical protein